MPLYGHELGEGIDPFQANLGWAVKLDQSTFLGHDVLYRLKDDASRPRRVGLELKGKRAAREGSPVLHGGNPVGHVTSGSFSPTLEKSIAMAYVAAEYSSLGTSLQVDIRGKTVAATVVPLPFYRRQK